MGTGGRWATEHTEATERRRRELTTKDTKITKEDIERKSVKLGRERNSRDGEPIGRGKMRASTKEKTGGARMGA